MAFRNWITEELILPTSDLLLGKSIKKNLNFLMKSQFWSRSELDQYQNENLKILIKHSFETVPYYNWLFKSLKLTPQDITVKEDLLKLPILTKEVIKNQGLEKFTSSAFSKKSLLRLSSSGSTGEPMQFYITKHTDSFNKAAAIRAWYNMGYRLGDKYVKISMNPRSSYLKKIQDQLNNCLYLSANELTENEFKKVTEDFIRFNPRIIRCYPTPLLFISELIQKNSYSLGGSLLGLTTTGSSLKTNDREKIETIFKKKIFDTYSCEGGAVCSQCESLENYHFAEEYAISEFIEDEYTLSDPGKPVRHITTDLQNLATPFIRYDSQDYLLLGSSSLCSCGRAFQNIKKIIGRDSDILITPSGKYLIVENFVAYFEWVESVDQFQVIQNSYDSIVINLKVNDKFSKKILQELLNYWKEYIGNDINLSIEVVSNIKLTPSGKRRTLIRNPKISINGHSTS